LEERPDEGPAPGVDGGPQTTPGSPSHQGPGSGSGSGSGSSQSGDSGPPGPLGLDVNSRTTTDAAQAGIMNGTLSGCLADDAGEVLPEFTGISRGPPNVSRPV